MRLIPSFFMRVCGLSFSEKKRVLRAVWKYLAADAAGREDFDDRGLRELRSAGERREVLAFSMIRFYIEHPLAVMAAPVGILFLAATLIMKVFNA